MADNDTASDVVIIGAGAAGLVAAAKLCRSGLRVTLVEARHRVGGRILTARLPQFDGGAEMTIELGAEFVHGRPPELLRILEEAGADLIETTGQDVSLNDGHLSTPDGGNADLLDTLADTVKREGDMTFDAFLERHPQSEEAAANAHSFVEGFNAADASRIGIAALARQQAAEEEIDGDRSWRVSNGYDVLPEYLARQATQAGAQIMLNSPVSAVKWSSGRVGLTIAGQGDLLARQAIVTLPLGVLQARVVAFDPEPLAIYTAADQMAAGSVQRLVLGFRSRFWERIVPEMRFLFGEGTPSTWWTQFPLETPVLVGWIGGPNATTEIATDPERLLNEALRTLERMFGLPQNSLDAELTSWHLHDWQTDPFTRGAYSYAPAGAADSSAAMTAPVNDTLFFAGEHTDVTGHWGTVHGALRSGMRVARQVLNSSHRQVQN